MACLSLTQLGHVCLSFLFDEKRGVHIYVYILIAIYIYIYIDTSVSMEKQDLIPPEH